MAPCHPQTGLLAANEYPVAVQCRILYSPPRLVSRPVHFMSSGGQKSCLLVVFGVKYYFGFVVLGLCLFVV